MAQDIRVALTLDNKQFNTALKQSEKNVKGLSGTTENTTTSVKGLAGAFQAFIAIGAVREIVRLTDQFTSLNNRLKAVTNSEKEAASALRLVQQVASETRSDLSAVAGLFADITIASEELGLSQERVAGIAKVFSQSLKVSGADAGTAAGAIRQFGQALASGVLRGDEFNSINEANSKFMGELAKALGVTRGELRLMAEQGEITADIMIMATEKMADNVEEAFGKTVGTIGDSFTNLRNAIVGTLGEIGETSGGVGALTEAIDALAAAINIFKPVINVIAGLVGALGELIKIALLFTVVFKGIKFAADGFFNVLKNKGGISIKSVSKGFMGLKASTAAWLTTTAAGTGVMSKFARVTSFLTGLIGSMLASLKKTLFTFSAWKIFFTSSLRPMKSITKETGLFRGILIGLGKVVAAVLRKFVGFLVVYDIFKLVIKALALIVDGFGKLLGFDFGLLDKVNKLFDAMGASIRKAGSDLWKFTKGLAGFKDAIEIEEPIDQATIALSLFNAQLKKVRSELSSNFLKNEDAGRYATDWENAQKRIKTVTDAIPVLEQGLFNAESFVGPLTEKSAQDLEKLRKELGATRIEFVQAQAAAQALKDGWTKSFDAISKSITDGLSLQDLTNEIADFDLSDMDKAIAQELRRITKVAEEETKKLTALIADPDIPDSMKVKWQTALDAIPNALLITSAEVKRLMTDLFGKKELKEATEKAAKEAEAAAKVVADALAGSTKALGDFQAQLANADTPQALENLRERLAELGRTGVLFGQDFIDATDAFKTAFESLGATDGVKLAIEDIAKSMSPFQLAVDATNAVWGNMSSAIDDLVDNGKASFSDLARSIIKDLSKMILKQMLFNAIAGFAGGKFGKSIGLDKLFPGKATGGPVAGNKPYMVGERGPELFVPSSAGSIVPNNGLGGGSVTNNNNYITNNINALDSKSVQQVFAENRQSLLGTVEYARKETAYGI